MQEEQSDFEWLYRPLRYFKLNTPDFFDQKIRRLRMNDKNPTQIFQDLAKIDFKLLNVQRNPIDRVRQRIFDTFLYQFKDQSVDFQKALKKEKMYHFSNISQIIKYIDDLSYKKKFQMPSNDFHREYQYQTSESITEQLNQVSLGAGGILDTNQNQDEFQRQNHAFLVAYSNIFEGDFQNVIFPFLLNQDVPSQILPVCHPFVYMYETLKINEQNQDKKESFTIPKMTFLNLDGTDCFTNWNYFMTQNNVQLISIIDEKQTFNMQSAGNRSWINQTLRDMDFDSEYNLLIPLRLKKPKLQDSQVVDDSTLTLGDQEMYYIFKKIQAQIQLFNPKLLVISYAFKYHYDSDIYIDPNILGEFINRLSENCTRIIFLPRYDYLVPENQNRNRDSQKIPKNQVYSEQEIIYMVDCLKAVAIGMNRSLLTERAVAFLECETGKQLSYYLFRKSFNEEMSRIRKELAIKAGKPSPDLMDQFDSIPLMIEKFKKQLNYRDTTNLRSFIEVPQIKNILKNRDADTKVELSIIQQGQPNEYYFDEQKSFLSVFVCQEYLLSVYVFQACTLKDQLRKYLNLFFRIDLSKGTKIIEKIYEFNFPFIVQDIKSICQYEDCVILMAQKLCELQIIQYPSLTGQDIRENLQNPHIYTHVLPLSNDYERLQNWTNFSMVKEHKIGGITQFLCIGGRAVEKKVQLAESPMIKLQNQIFHIDLFINEKKFKATVYDEKQMLPSSMIPTLFPLVFTIKSGEKDYYFVFGGEQISFDAQQDLKMDSYYIFHFSSSKGIQIKNVKIMECQSKYEKKGINFYGMTSRNTILFHKDDKQASFAKLKFMVNSSLRTLKTSKKLKQRPPKQQSATIEQRLPQQAQQQSGQPVFIYINSELPIMAKQYINFKIDHQKLQSIAESKARIDNWSQPQHHPIIFSDKNLQISSAGFKDSFLRDNEWYQNDDAPKPHCWSSQVNG